MPPFGPLPRRKLVRGLRDLGFEGPFTGGRHEFMVKAELVVTIPNPHGGDIGIGIARPHPAAGGGLARRMGTRVAEAPPRAL
jgi:predicted RNA binding protein YcfA (HicA-like mRNA interferase family)